MTYHDNNLCGACGGPLECHRDAICESCVPESTYFDACESVWLAGEERNWRYVDCRGGVFRGMAFGLPIALAIWGGVIWFICWIAMTVR